MRLFIKKAWETYEEVAAYLLNQFKEEFGLKCVEGKQKLKGSSQTDWEIDAKGIKEEDKGFVIVECRRYLKKRLSQKEIAALAYQISDTGASGGIIVSPLSIQEGARKVAQSGNILEVKIGPNSTASEFFMQFLEKLMVGIKISFGVSFTATAELFRPCPICGQKIKVGENESYCPSCNKSNLFDIE
jgi:hypothetical protein